MPTVKPGSKVLVTGASGFIATWVVKTLLERGFHVRGTVRSTAKGDYLVNLFKDHADRFEYFVVEDISKESTFDEAVKGIDAVEHTASPVHFLADEPDEIITPAVKGTLSILESVLKNGSNVQRVVVTSSLGAIIEPADEQRIYSEKDWNELSLREIKNKGRESAGIHKYRASKTLAEKAAWDFVEKYKSSIKWDVTVLNPPLVWGPTIHEAPTPESLNSSISDIYSLIKRQRAVSAAPFGNCVDVRDLASAHVAVLENEKAGGERFIVATGPCTWQDFLDGLHSDPEFSALPRGTPGEGKNFKNPVLLDTTKAGTVLGLRFREVSEIAKDSVRSLLEKEKLLGW